MLNCQRNLFLLSTKCQFMKESNTLADNAGINLLQNKTQKSSTQRSQVFCEQCGLQFTVKGSLAKHQRAIQEGVKHPCRQCGHQFASKGYLAEQQRAVHEGIKHPCSQCGHQFTSKVHLTRHRRVVHEGVKHSCKQCDLQFTVLPNT